MPGLGLSPLSSSEGPGASSLPGEDPELGEKTLMLTKTCQRCSVCSVSLHLSTNHACLSTLLLFIRPCTTHVCPHCHLTHPCTRHVCPYCPLHLSILQTGLSML